MLVHRKKRSGYSIQMPLTPLIDIVFLLLIYFLLTTNFLVEEGITIKLPEARASAPRTRQEITVTVDRDGRTYLMDRPVTEDELFRSLRDMIGGERDRLVVVRADRAVMLNRVVKAMDLAKAAGAERLFLATEKDF